MHSHDMSDTFSQFAQQPPLTRGPYADAGCKGHGRTPTYIASRSPPTCTCRCRNTKSGTVQSGQSSRPAVSAQHPAWQSARTDGVRHNASWTVCMQSLHADARHCLRCITWCGESHNGARQGRAQRSSVTVCASASSGEHCDHSCAATRSQAADLHAST